MTGPAGFIFGLTALPINLRCPLTVIYALRAQRGVVIEFPPD